MTQSTLSLSPRKPKKTSERGGQLAFWLAIGTSFLFVFFIWLLGGRLESVALLPDKGATWYFWQLPEPTFWTQATVWAGYVLHQLFMWGTIIYAKRNVRGYTSGLHPINLVALLGNAAFIGLHFVQTQIWYDGLAQNLPLQSSEASVVLLLVMVLLMENRRRGLFFGKKLSFLGGAVDFVRHNHGYVFAWAVAYTFWFHPMVATPSHLVGFLYMFFLMVQGSLFFTRMHLNRYWTVFLELLVLAHGALVVAMLGRDSVWAFVLGFFGIFLISQMHGLKLKPWLRWSALGGYLLLIAIGFYLRGGAVLRDVLFLPVMEYALVFILAGLIAAGLGVRRLTGKLATSGEG